MVSVSFVDWDCLALSVCVGVGAWVMVLRSAATKEDVRARVARSAENFMASVISRCSIRVRVRGEKLVR